MSPRTLLRTVVEALAATGDPTATNPSHPASIRHEWDRRRAAASTSSERHEIDAIYSRVVP